MAEKKKRSYTFRKGLLVPYQAGSIRHKDAKIVKQLMKGETKSRKKGMFW